MRLKLEHSMVGNYNQGKTTYMTFAFALYPTEVNVKFLYQKHKNTRIIQEVGKTDVLPFLA